MQKKKTLKKIVSTAHDKGGTGKSTTAINTIVELNREYELTVIDLDPKKQFSTFNKLREQKTKLEKINQFEVTDSKSLIDFARNYEGLIFIDLGGYDSNLFRQALFISDLLIVPLSSSDNDVLGLKDFAKILGEVRATQKEKEIDAECCILVNRVHHANKSAYNRLSKYAVKHDFTIFDTVIRQNTVYENMISKGKNACEITSGTSGINVKKLVDEIKEKIEG